MAFGVKGMNKGHVERLFPYYVDTGRALGFDRDRWCIDTFGPKWNMEIGHPGRWTKTWLGLEGDPNRYRWRFREEKDLMWFSLRWPGV